MTTKKASAMIKKSLFRRALLLMFMLLMVGTAHAVITAASVVLTADVNGDGIAGIGDTLTFSCRSNLANADPDVDLSRLGNPSLSLVRVGPVFTAIQRIAAGNVNNELLHFTIRENGGSASQQTTNTIEIDNRAPVSTNGPTVSGHSSGNVFKYGDKLKIFIELNNSSNSDSIIADLSGINLSNNHIFSPSGSGKFSMEVNFPANLEGNSTVIAIVGRDQAGNRTSWSRSVAYDTKIPVIQSVTAINTASNKVWAEEGSIIRIQALIQSWDEDQVLVESQLSSFGSGLSMAKKAGNVIGQPATFEYEYTVTSQDIIDATNGYADFSVTATDDAGNPSNPRVSNRLAFNEVLSHPASKVEVSERKGVFGDGVAIVGDILTFTCELASVDPKMQVTVDLSSIGGVSNQLMLRNGSSYTYSYPVSKSTSDDSIPRTFYVTVKDSSNNSTREYILPVIYVDNQPPLISAPSISNTSRPGQIIKHGDTFSIQANIQNLDGGNAWVDLRRLGGAASSNLTLSSGNTYRIEMIAGDPVDSLQPYDQYAIIPINALDNAGNMAEIVNAQYNIDNVPPVILSSSFTSIPTLSPTHPYVKMNDDISFSVSLKDSGSSAHDKETVTLDLSVFGITNPVSMNYDGTRFSYYYTTKVPRGTANGLHFFNFTATDDADNIIVGVIEVKIDNSPSEAGPMTVNFLTDMSKAGVINVGDRLEFIVPVADPDDGSCFIDLSLIGGDSKYEMTYDSSLPRYYLVHDCTATTMENPGKAFTATVLDKAGNSMVSISAVKEVDCRLPIINSFSVSHKKKMGNQGIVCIGDELTFTTEVDSATIDGAIPSINLMSVGGVSNHWLIDRGNNIWSDTITVSQGDIDMQSIYFSLDLIDDGGNKAINNTFATPFMVDSSPVSIISIEYEHSLDSNGNGLIDIDGTYISTGAEYATDTVTISAIISENASVHVDLREYGYGESATEMEVKPVSGGYEAKLIFMPKRGTTNGEDIRLIITATDDSGNQSLAETNNTLKVDNMVPIISEVALTFIEDKGNIGDVNLGDTIKIEAVVTNNDGLSPLFDLRKLFADNGMSPPVNEVIMLPDFTGSNRYSGQWTANQAGLGSLSSLQIVTRDENGNMTVTETPKKYFITKELGAGQSSAIIVQDNNFNGILNPGDKVGIAFRLSDSYSNVNIPAMKVMVDLSIISDVKTSSFIDDGYWVELEYDGRGGPPYLYTGEFIASATINEKRGLDFGSAAFKVKVMHPTNPNETVLDAVVDGAFPIDTKVPNVITGTIKMRIVEENGDNLASHSANIGDIIEVWGDIMNYADPSSATALLYNNGGEIIGTVPMGKNLSGGANSWLGQTTIATATRASGEAMGDGEWRIANGDIVRIVIAATDDAGNTSFSNSSPTNPNGIPVVTSPNIKIDTQPPLIDNLVISMNDTNGDTIPVVNVGNGVATDSISVTVELDPNTPVNTALNRGRAYIDLSPIGATSTYMLKPSSTGSALSFGTTNALYPAPYAHYVPQLPVDLASYSFRVYVVDEAGNKAYIEDRIYPLAVDTKMPELSTAYYDGSLLTLSFTENIVPSTLDVSNIRIGKQPILTDLLLNGGNAVELSPGVPGNLINDIILNISNDMNISIQLGPETRGKIADWGKTDLYISIASLDYAPGHIITGAGAKFLAKDASGNWLKPVLRNSPKNIEITGDYTNNVKLVRGRYDASNSTSRQFLYLDFDKLVDLNSINNGTLEKLAIWRNRSDAGDNFSNRYRFSVSGANDTYDMANSSAQTIRINLSQEAQDWIALNYGNNRSEFHLSINPPIDNNDPPLIRDHEGNRVVSIPYNLATQSTLVPLIAQFSAQSSKLDLSGAYPILTINFDSDARVRLYQDFPYVNSQNTVELSRDLPMNMSGIFLYASKNMASGSTSLNNVIVDYTAYKLLNTDYASNTVQIPLTAEGLKTILGWGTSQFYLACGSGAFRDMWGNSNNRYPVQGDEAVLVTFIPPIVGIAPSVRTLAVSPIKMVATPAPGVHLLKGHTIGSFIYEVSFETAALSANVHIPIDRTVMPKLEMNNVMGGTLVDTAIFVNWVDHVQGNVTRTSAIFRNNTDFSGGNIQREDCLVSVSNFKDIFGNLGSVNVMTQAYDLTKKNTNSLGFAGASLTLVLDSKVPEAISALPNGSIGITPANGKTFEIKFNEPMDARIGNVWQPTLRLGNASSNVMSFRFVGWASSDTARFTNTANFDASTPQGEMYYYVSGGYDEAGNRGNDDYQVPGVSLIVRSRGPAIKSYIVSTYQSTTAKYSSPTGDLIDAPFSPYVAPNVATISVEFEAIPSASSLWMHLYQGESSLASMPITLAGGGFSGHAEWNGNLKTGSIGNSGPHTYVLRIYDSDGNEASKRGKIVYDGLPPNVASWRFSNIRTLKKVGYFSPNISSFAKIDVFGPSSNDVVKMRLTSTDSGTATETFPMVTLSGGGFTTSFDGNSTDSTVGSLPEGKYMVALVDLAGNLATSGSGNSTSGIVIDRTAPGISSIKMYLSNSGKLVSRFNPNVSSLKFEIGSGEPDVASGTAVIHIKAGSVVIRELLIEGGASPFIAEWDGKDKDGQLVADGDYQITVTDLAGNPSALTENLAVVSSKFKVTGVTQLDRQKILVSFNHHVDPVIAATNQNYSIAPLTPAGIGIGLPIEVNDNNVIIPMNSILGHDIEYTVTVKDGFKSIDGDSLELGFNSAQFKADTQGPVVTAITFDGLTSQKQFNAVFDEEIDQISAQDISKYTLTGSGTVNIESIIIRSDLKSVTLTCFDDITEDVNYTLVVVGVEDMLGNLSDGVVSRISFQGQDVTHPELTLSAFSNPANEFDISIVVKSNENLLGAPKATIIQSGGTAVAIALNSGATSRLFIGGVHLDSNYPGVVTIKVTGSDASNNQGTANMSFSTAYVNRSVRASIKSIDNTFEVVFDPGTLIKNSVVTIMNESLVKTSSPHASDSSVRASIIPEVFAGLSNAQRGSIRGSSVTTIVTNDEELIPIGQAYSLNIPAGRMSKKANASIKISAEQLGTGIGLYKSYDKGWEPVTFVVENGKVVFEAQSGGTFVMMKDILAPRATLLTKVDENEPITKERPMFFWSIEELASGVDIDNASVVLNGKTYPLMLDKNSKLARFVAMDGLVNGEHDINLRLSDKAGNASILESVRFVVDAPISIEQVIQYPNPARRRVRLRILSNRKDLDDYIDVKIYDTAGHKVADDRNINILRSSDNGTKAWQNVEWNLRNLSGRNVANGVYFAKISIRDPKDWNRKTRYTCKIAVLR